ncbi:outer membrane protein [Methylobacterium aerolatum]|uniref:Opacity protein n=1 Tax=Methylobacterium aerolatum TaxID=418708 RepID=A0ABU0HYV6_9HYPH|nr:hypothetical protein [Methylobacterium aerolatum]MDQ0447501.1 hypothetical protein [Methylobacterium aerolatum]GJD34602.1 hypothetical protein FMGBMHLM_1504 [Methylobacterium aerolatum]
MGLIVFAPRVVRAAILGVPLLAAAPAAAQVFPFSVGFGPLPSFAWPREVEDGQGRWAGSYARLSTGFEAVSSKRFGGYAGPTIGFEGGRLWQDGNLVYGFSGAIDALIPASGGGIPGYNRLSYSRDVAAAFDAKVGTLLTPNVLLYGKVGAYAVHETLRAGPTATSLPFSQDQVALRPDARVGVEWALTDRTTLSLEAGVVGNRLR